MHRIRTTHTGSLPRPDDLAQLLIAHDRGDEAPGLEERVRTGVAEVVARQVECGLDLVNDGEAGKLGYAVYVKDRLTGFDGEARWVGERRPEMDEHPDFGERWRAATANRTVLDAPACSGDIRPRDATGVRRDITTLRAAAAAAGIATDRLFMTAASPGVISHFFANEHYPTREAYVGALADAMRPEYEAIAGAGIRLQIDCPDLAMSRHSVFAHLTVEEFRREAMTNVEALNHAVANIPPEAMRMHVCWGNYEGPHTHDVALRSIVDIVLRARPAGISLESCNPRHGHEWRVWEEVPLPDGRYLVPGVVDTTTNYVEHPELVAQRIVQYARVVGPAAVVAGSDCGFGTLGSAGLVSPSVAWAKLEALVAGAELASRELA